MVPAKGLEPLRMLLRWILNPLRLPIPPGWHKKSYTSLYFDSNKSLSNSSSVDGSTNSGNSSKEDKPK